MNPPVAFERALSTGPAVLADSVPLSAAAFRLIAQGVRSLWQRILADDPAADAGPLLLSYDVHPTPAGPVLIEVNTNAGGILSAMQAARQINECCADWEQDQFERRLLTLFRRDLLGDDPKHAGVIAIVDDDLAAQPLLGEMRALAQMLRDEGHDVRVIDASELRFHDGRLRQGEVAIDRVYWRSTDFLLTQPVHEPVRRAVAEGTTAIAPSPGAYKAIADKRRFVDWSKEPELARDDLTGMHFCIAETVSMTSRSPETWYAERKDWVFKPVSGHAGRGVYVGKSISRQKLATLPADGYLAQRYTPHPLMDRDGTAWKYDVRFFADRGQIISAAARVFKGQVVGMQKAGSGFAPVRIDSACCLVGALAKAVGR